MKKLSLLIIVTIILSTMAYADGQVDISYAGYTISQPGSYIVVNDLHAAVDQNAITIETSNVNIDLNGHTLYGAGTVTGTTGTGIYSVVGSNNISVTNGKIREFRIYGIDLNGSANLIRRIQVFANRSIGIDASDKSQILENIVHGNYTQGIYASINSIIRDNIIEENGIGIYAFENTQIRNNIIQGNNSYGIYVSQNGAVTGNHVRENGFDGIYVGAGSTVKDNTVNENNGDGIEVTFNCLIEGNNCNNNGFGSTTGAGIRATSNDNSIKNNLLADNDMGLLLEVAGNYYGSNQASGNSYGNYSTVGAQTDGGTIDASLSNVSFYNQPNYLIQRFAGFEIPAMRESTEDVIRKLIW